MKFIKGEQKNFILDFIRVFLRLFWKFPFWGKLFTLMIVWLVVIKAINGVQDKFTELTQSSSSVVSSDASSPVSSPASDPFSDGISKATNAAKLAQTAKTVDEWSKVASEWKAAINFMKAVSSTSPNYSVAQQRIVTYPKNLAYAHKNVQTLKQKQSRIQQSQVIRGQQVFKSLKGIYQVAGGFTPIPVVRVIIPKTGWDRLSEADKVSLTMYAESLISIVKSNPAKYVDISPSAPAYNLLVSKTANICQDCWSIILSYKNSQPYDIDTTVVQGDTPWQQEDSCCRGVKASEFRQ